MESVNKGPSNWVEKKSANTSEISHENAIQWKISSYSKYTATIEKQNQDVNEIKQASINAKKLLTDIHLELINNKELSIHERIDLEVLSTRLEKIVWKDISTLEVEMMYEELRKDWPNPHDAIIPDYLYRVRRVFNEQSKTITQDLNRLAKSEKSEDRQFAARHLKTSPETLVSLAKDPDFEVRMRVSNNPNTPIEGIVILSYDKEARIKSEIIELSKNISTETLVRLTHDSNWNVQKEAKTRLFVRNKITNEHEMKDRK